MSWAYPTPYVEKPALGLGMELLRKPGVRWVEPNHTYRAAGPPNDRLFSRQFTLSRPDGIGAASVWWASRGSGATVAVLDSGVDTKHPDLAPNLWRNPSEVPANGIDEDSDGFVDDVHGADVVRGGGLGATTAQVRVLDHRRTGGRRRRAPGSIRAVLGRDGLLAGRRIASHRVKTWVLTGSLENFRATRGRSFALVGAKEGRRAMAEQIEPGDEIVFYVTGVQCFGATVRVTSEMFEDRAKVWPGKPGKADAYPWRFETEPVLVLDEERFVPASELASDLEHVRKWPAEHWHLAFQGQLRAVSETDAALLTKRMKAAATAPSAA